jgi:hypothetical protein
MKIVKIKLSVVSDVEIAIDVINNPDFKRGEEDASRQAPYKPTETLAWRTGWVAYWVKSSPQHARPLVMAGESIAAAVEVIRQELRC